tara:strand:- start:49 stop:306 length:258 start_codon:yes stop_codon:yes gene_type:complete
MNNTVLDHIIDSLPHEEILKANGFDDAVIGIDLDTMRLIYSKLKCIEVVMEAFDFTYDEAFEFLDFNVFGYYVGNFAPIWCDDTI